jgi:hypothetical protein
VSVAAKVVRDGQVAVLVSKGFGAGWLSWNGEIPECATHPEIVALVENKATATTIEARANELWPNGYWGGADGLRIVWVPEGMGYHIDDYDGNESITLRSETDRWRVA